VMLDKMSNGIMFAVIGFGGFLGMGEKYHAIPWASLDYDKDMGGYVVPFNKEQLKAAPAYSIDELTGADGEAAHRSPGAGVTRGKQHLPRAGRR
ncbi:PRC-barrel domain containing protein, partial [Mesorhizobium sp. M1D.F.Ca.ET.184.01.1.1]|uniref:PRC-barrel domain-containing protein n=1 Tax=Mesorhizobium sp. M1D.F.Ca.ET.184.01.1.1 TaxID=2563931 RepID=UPI00109336F0